MFTASTQSFWPKEEDFHPGGMMYGNDYAPEKNERLTDPRWNSNLRGFNKRKGKRKDIIMYMGATLK